MISKKKFLIVASSAMLTFGMNAETITTNEEWYDPSDWFDGDDVDYEQVDTLAGTYAEDPEPSGDLDSWDKRYDSLRLYGDSLGYVYTSYLILPYEEGEQKWQEQNTSESKARKEYENAEKDRDYVRGESKSSQSGYNKEKADKKKTDKKMKSDQGQPSDYEKMLVRGEIEAFSQIDFEGESKDNDLIKIKLENGDSAVVDLGTDSARDDLQLKDGDRIMVRGTKDKIDGKIILVAEEVTVGNPSSSQKDKKSKNYGDQKQKDQHQKMKSMHDSHNENS